MLKSCSPLFHFPLSFSFLLIRMESWGLICSSLLYTSCDYKRLSTEGEKKSGVWPILLISHLFWWKRKVSLPQYFKLLPAPVTAIPLPPWDYLRLLEERMDKRGFSHYFHSHSSSLNRGLLEVFLSVLMLTFRLQAILSSGQSMPKEIG